MYALFDCQIFKISFCFRTITLFITALHSYRSTDYYAIMDIYKDNIAYAIEVVDNLNGAYFIVNRENDIARAVCVSCESNTDNKNSIGLKQWYYIIFNDT